MEAAHFGSWPRASGVASISVGLAAGTIAVGFTLWALNSWPLHRLLIAHNVALLFSLVAVYGVVTLGCPDMTLATTRWPQVDPVASFNRGVCTAWCRRYGLYSVAGQSEECGVKPDDAFELLMTSSVSSKVAKWCEQAILRESFSANATYNGSEPFSMLTRDTEVCLPTVWLVTVAVLVAVFASLTIAIEVLIIDALITKARSRTAEEASETKLKQSLVPSEVAV